MHLVQTFMRLTRPFSTTLIFWRFGSQMRTVFLLEWLTLWPY